MNNWFKVSRSLFENRMWLSQPFTDAQAWIDMVGNANFSDGLIVVRGNRVEVKRGQLAWSERFMANRWKWSRGKVRRFLVFLKNEQQIVPQTDHIISLINILNYNKYQENSTTDSTTDGPQTVPIHKNVKKEKNNITEKTKLIHMTNDQIFEMAMALKISGDDVKAKHEDVWYAIENGDKYKTKDTLATTRNWCRMAIERGTFEQLNEIQLHILNDKYNPETVEQERLMALSISETKND